MSRPKDSPVELKHRSDCPITCALELFGDKWSLLLIRDVMMGKHRYGEFEKSPEQIPTNILASRLKKLVNCGLFEKCCYQERPQRYAYLLTEKGAGLIDVIKAIANWSISHDVGEGWEMPDGFWQITSQEVLIQQQQNLENLLECKGEKSDN